MKHGPIAIIDERMPVVIVVPRNESYEKVVSNLEEVQARSGKVIAVTTDDCADLADQVDALIMMTQVADAFDVGPVAAARVSCGGAAGD